MDWQPPKVGVGALMVWRRNALVWRKLFIASILMNFGEPLIYLLGLGFGLGMFIGKMAEMPYITFLASGVVASSVMMSATFEGLYSVFTRMVPQETYAGMMTTPLSVDEIIAGEWLWCASKALLSGCAILIVAYFLGAVAEWRVLWAIPVLFLIGLTFAGPALVVTAFSPSYDFFSYYQTLILTPMFILCGVFYPTSTLPEAMQGFIQLLPLTHAVALVRPLVAGQPLTDVALHLAVLLSYAVVGFYLAVVLVRRRLLV